ncbi:MAG: diphosphomevalonate decarboxylase [Myxococcota bacterium]|nr:diphosphomevalonate decarboxylase [Myxococcota bacterium]
MSAAVALAHPNFALSKYWGKRDGSGNFPAVPSLSVTVAGLATRTEVRFDSALSADRVVIGGRDAPGAARARVVELLDRVRCASGEARRAEVLSNNDFPTASGLASSASGFAALAVATVRAAGLDWDSSRVSDLARRSSGSAARSIFGGFVELQAGAVGARESDVLAAQPIAPADHMPLVVVVAVTTDECKPIASRDGMRQTMERSPYARAWLEEAPKLHVRLREALLARDFAGVGELAERSALAMHASAIAAGLLYWNAGTLAALQTVRTLRDGGTRAYATIDAGPHVKVLARPEDAERVRSSLEATRDVLRATVARVGQGARLVDVAEARS